MREYPTPYTPVMARRRGRPAIGERVCVRLSSQMLAAVDQRADRQGTTRAAALRSLLAAGLESSDPWGVDAAQLERMLSLTPGQRVRHAAAAAKQLRRIGGASPS